MKSRELEVFINEIQFINRNPRDNSVLNLLDDISTNPEFIITSDMKLYRSRIVCNNNTINKYKNFYGYGPDESFVPPKELTKDMRANYRYIPYLYCSDHPYLSMVETRPHYNTVVSVAILRTNENLRLLDFTMRVKPQKMLKAKQDLFDDLSEIFSKPVTIDDDVLDYIPTQYIAEYVKNLGYDGISFESSLNVNMGINNVSQKTNIVIFKYKKCIPVCSNVYQITDNSIECKQIDDDIERKEIISPMAEELSSLL